MEWLFCQENLRVRSRILDIGASLRIHGFSWKSSDFAGYICQFSEKVRSSLHTFENSAFGASEFDTPIWNQKWSACFVERIRGSDRRSPIRGSQNNIAQLSYTLTQAHKHTDTKTHIPRSTDTQAHRQKDTLRHRHTVTL